MRKKAAFGSTLAWTIGLLAPPAQADVSFEFVTVGHPGNPTDPLVENGIPGEWIGVPGIGAVEHEFRIATYEVTYAQWCEFLNTVDPEGVDALDLYREPLAPSILCGININFGADPGEMYVVQPGCENRAAANLSLLAAMRFCNWLHNGQGAAGTPQGETETGVYTITDGLTETRSPGAKFFLPTENEWFKAAYYQPASEGGDSDNYWFYPFGSNDVPVAGVDGYFGLATGHRSDVGSFPGAVSFYGAFDMGGGVFEYTETPLLTSSGVPVARIISGGAFNFGADTLRAINRNTSNATGSQSAIGFRVAASLENDCAADINDDGDVAPADFTAWLACFSFPGSASFCSRADVNGNGTIEPADFTAWLAAFNAGCP